MECAEACDFENAKNKIEEDISLNNSFEKKRLPESWLLLGNIYRLEGLYPEARQWTTRGLSFLEKQKPQDKKRLSAAYNYLALLNNNAGQFSQSEKNARLALSCSSEAQLGKANEAMHRVVLANALRQQGKYKDALVELEIALPILQSSDQKRLLATAINNLGDLYFWLGDYQRSLPTLRDGLNASLQICGENHPDVANSYMDLGCVEFKLGQTDSAIKDLRLSRQIRLDKLGANHPETLSAASNLAVVLLSTGERREALELLKDTVARAKTVLGGNNADLAQYEDDFANALCQDKQFDAARSAQMESLAIRKNIFGVTSRDYASGLRSLAQIETAAGNGKECLLLLLKSIAIYNACGLHPDLDLAETLDELATYYAAHDQLEKSRQTFVLAIREKWKTGDSISYATSLANLAELLHRMNNDAESAVMLKKAAAAIEALPQAQKNTPDALAILERCKQSGATTKGP